MANRHTTLFRSATHRHRIPSVHQPMHVQGIRHKPNTRECRPARKPNTARTRGGVNGRDPTLLLHDAALHARRVRARVVQAVQHGLLVVLRAGGDEGGLDVTVIVADYRQRGRAAADANAVELYSNKTG